MTVISCFLLVVEDQAERIASLNPDLRFWRTLFSAAGYCLRCSATLGLLLVVIPPERRHWSVWVPSIVNLLVCLTAFFTDIAFGFDSDYVFYRGPLGYVSFIVPLMHLVAILWLTFRNYEDSRKKPEQLILITCAVFGMLSALLDVLLGGVRLHEALLISSIFFYVFLRSYDVRRDSLTLLLNRQSLYDDCRSEGNGITAAASLDMNGLKNLNNKEGYSTGDAALRKIGECLAEASGHSARAYRIGGDEFVMLFFHEDEAAVVRTLEDIRTKVEGMGYSVASGYAMREKGDDPDHLIRRSDQKMFEQKGHYYRLQSEGRRRKREAIRTDLISDEIRETIGELPQPVSVYHYADHNIETLAVSDGYCGLFGYPDRKQALYILDHDRYKDIHADDRERTSGALLRFADGNEDLDVVYRTAAGMASGYRVIHARGCHVYAENGMKLSYIWYMNEGEYMDGDEDAGTPVNQALNRALHEASILHAANYDELTGLPNLAWFFRLYDAGKARNLSEGKQTVLLYLDLNGMKYFNHKNGFAEGDKLLKGFAELLAETFGKENCCHVSADRYAAGTTGENLEDRIRKLFDDAKRVNGGKTLPVRVGICLNETENISAGMAYDRAKIACDAARRSGDSCFSYFSNELREEDRRHQYLTENIDRAIAERWIQVYYQPIVRAADGRTCELEALARWIDPAEGFLSPAAFIPHLEKAGLIYKLDLCMLEQVLEKIRGERETGKDPLPHSINLSRSDFDACDIVEEICRRVDGAGVPRNMIAIEVTESIIASDLDFMRGQVERFHELGFPVWMDDFGSGYSSLDVLQSIPFDLIKFDMSFMRKLDEGEGGRIILTQLMKLAEALKADTICEGVETETQVRFLRSIGCRKLQGFYFGRPVPAKELKEREEAGKEDFVMYNPDKS